MSVKSLFFIYSVLFLSFNLYANQTIKIAHIDPQSGPFALQGASGSKHIQKTIDVINSKGGVLGKNLELVKFDNKSSPQESLVALKKAIDMGIKYITQGNGSHVAHALSDAIKKHNQRNPGKEVLFLNHAAVDPALTNEKCQFYHFRFDVNVDMKIEALTEAIAKDKKIKRVYLINQDYSYGHAVQKAANIMLKKKRPDIKIVGDELHPIGKIKDFAPYVSKIKESKADAILSGNWGNDLTLLIKAADESGITSPIYTNYAYLIGTPRVMGKQGANRVRAIVSWHANIDGYPFEDYYLSFKKQHKGEDWGFVPIKYAIEMWAMAMEKSKSTEAKAVAYALEDMRYDGGLGEVWMRPGDHQIMEPIYVALFTEVGGKVKYDADNSGYGWKTEVKISGDRVAQPHTCNMKRP